MPHDELKRADRERVITLDLLADWRLYADPLPSAKNNFDWRYSGTVTRDGVTSALAWQIGNYGFGRGRAVAACGFRDRIKITHILLFDRPPGLDSVPKFVPANSPIGS